jgi:ABC-type molybdate transport system substrate-binding protein
MGSAAISPESYLLALASVAPTLISKQPPPKTVKMLPAELAAEQFVAKDSLAIWNWPIFPSGFHSTHLMELARLQAWTLKPALLPAAR